MSADLLPDLLGTAPADLIDRVAEPPPSTLDEARKRAERLRAGIVRYSEMRQDIADAYACRDWLALGYDNWHAYVEGEFGKELRELSRSDRPLAVRDLRTQGMSTRQIGTAVGVSREQVRRDLAQVTPDVSPATVTGADGKTYAAAKPPRTKTPAGPPSLRPDQGEAVAAGEPAAASPTTDHPQPHAGEAAARLDATGPAAGTREAPTGRAVGAGETAAGVGPQSADAVGEGASSSAPARAAAAGAPVGEGTAGAPVTPSERPQPPAWDPDERRAHEAQVRKNQDIEAAHRFAKRIVGDLQTAVLTIVTGYRHGETDLVTPDTIRELRQIIDTLEAEL